MERKGGGAGVGLQGCVIQPGRFSPCCEKHRHTPKTLKQEGRAVLQVFPSLTNLFFISSLKSRSISKVIYLSIIDECADYLVGFV